MIAESVVAYHAHEHLCEQCGGAYLWIATGVCTEQEHPAPVAGEAKYGHCDEVCHRRGREYGSRKGLVVSRTA